MAKKVKKVAALYLTLQLSCINVASSARRTRSSHLISLRSVYNCQTNPTARSTRAFVSAIGGSTGISHIPYKTFNFGTGFSKRLFNSTPCKRVETKINRSTEVHSHSKIHEEEKIKMSTPNTVRVKERKFTCSDGVELAARCWTNFDPLDPSSSNITTRKILCLHGWLDNAASFDQLAPLLLGPISSSASDGSFAVVPTEIVALDFPGHGLSGHKSVDGPPQLLAEYAFYVAECIEALQWGNSGNVLLGIGDSVRGENTQNKNSNQNQKIILIGHSMGAGVTIVVGAAFPEWFSTFILLEGSGPMARNAKDCARHVRAACQRRLRSNRTLFPNAASGNKSDGSTVSRARVYKNLDEAVEARLDTARRMPGDQYLSLEAAKAMVMRATVPATVPSAAITTSIDMPVTFRHDPRLQWPSLQYYTREQVEAFFHDIQSPVCLLTAEDGWPADSWSEETVTTILKPKVLKKLPGSHHFHADPDSVKSVANEVVLFLKDNDF